MNGYSKLLPVALGLSLIGRESRSQEARNTCETTQTTLAVRTTQPPLIDGHAEPSIWITPADIESFCQSYPSEAARTAYATEVRVLYDNRNLFVHVRAHDPAPDSIRSHLTRRDEVSTSDEITVAIDAYLDQRSGFEFTVNPSGVQRDVAVFNDADRDASWDAVWESATHVDSLGWSAELRIPLSQLRYDPDTVHTFGFAVTRTLAGRNQVDSWPMQRRSQAGIVSQWGRLVGIQSISTVRRLEVLPYALVRSEPGETGVATPGSSQAADQSMTIGGDVRYGVNSGLTLSGTVNPDFAQVEADPAIFNLSDIDPRLEERRPFFLEGIAVFRCSVCRTLFYSRNIGRTPQLPGAPGSSPPARILAAAKLSGHLGSRFSIGLVNATTRREENELGRTIEPAANFSVARLSSERADGTGAVGVTVTGLRRFLDADSEDHLHRSAYATALDFYRQLWGRRYAVSGSAAFSHVVGTRKALIATQLASARYFQRPNTNEFDSTRTSLSGSAVRLSVSKISGVLSLDASYARLSPGYEVNDVGFEPIVDQQSWTLTAGLRSRAPRLFYRQLSATVTSTITQNLDGLTTGRSIIASLASEFQGGWYGEAGLYLSPLSSVVSDRETRGGPTMRLPARRGLVLYVRGDNRKRLVPGVLVNYFVGAGGSSDFRSIGPFLSIRPADYLTIRLGSDIWTYEQDVQYYAQLGSDFSDTTHYLFAHLSQEQVNINARIRYLVTPRLSLDIYASPFATAGKYSNVRELTAPLATRHVDQFEAYTSIDDQTAGGFDFGQFRSNTVVRWEYRPGSTLYFVWAQERTTSGGFERDISLDDAYSKLFRERPLNVFLIKASFWFAM